MIEKIILHQIRTPSKSNKKQTKDNSSLFAKLISRGVSFRAFVVLLAYLQQTTTNTLSSSKSGKSDQDFEALKFACSRALIWFFSMDGSATYNVFNPFVLRACFSNLKQFLFNINASSSNSKQNEEDEESSQPMEDIHLSDDDEDEGKKSDKKRKKNASTSQESNSLVCFIKF